MQHCFIFVTEHTNWHSIEVYWQFVIYSTSIQKWTYGYCSQYHV